MQFTLATRLSNSSGPSVEKRFCENGRGQRRKKTIGRWWTTEEELVVTHKNGIYRSSVPSDDDPMSASPHPRQFLQDHFTSAKRDNTESCKNPCLRRTENYPGEEYLGNYLQDEQLSRERKLMNGLLSVTEVERSTEKNEEERGCEYIDVDDRVRDEDDQRRPPFDAHPVVFAANRLALVRSTRRFRTRVRRERRVGRRSGDGWLTRREGSSQHFFFVFRPQKREARSREGREIKTRMIEDDQRSKDEVHGARGGQCNEQDEVWRLPRSYSLKYARHYCREKEEER